MGCQTSFAQLPCMPSRGCPSRGLLRPRAFFNRSSVASATTAQAPISLELQKQVSFGESIKVVGSSAALGNWNVDQAPSLTWSEGDVWKITLDFEPGSPAEFKFVVVSGGSTVWEDGGNRTYEAKSQKPARLSCKYVCFVYCSLRSLASPFKQSSTRITTIDVAFCVTGHLDWTCN